MGHSDEHRPTKKSKHHGSLAKGQGEALFPFGHEESLARHAQRQALLLSLMHDMLAAELDEAGLTRVLFEKLSASLDADVCFNYRFDPECDGLRLVAGFGIPPVRREEIQVLALGQAFCGTVAASREPLVADAARIASEDKGACLRAMGVRAYACHPLFNRDGQVLGTLALASTRRDGFTSEEVAFLQTLCNFVAQAWERLDDQRKLLQSENRFAALVDASFEAIAISEGGRIVDANPQFARMYGYEPDEVVGMEVSTFIANEDREAVMERIRSGKAYQAECLNVKKDGTVFNVEVNARSVSWRGRTMRVSAIRDITARKRSEEELKKERSFFRQVIDAVPGFIFVKDLDGRFTLANRAVAEAYGTTTTELIGKTDWDFNPNREEVEHFLHDDREVILGCRAKFIPEEKVTDTQGHSLWVATFKIPLIDNDGSCCRQVLGVSSDITARKRSEDALRDADRRKDEFLAMLAHELRNPLAPIRNAVNVLRLLGPHDPAQERQQNIIQRQVTHMARLLDDLLDVSRITRGKVELRRVPLDLAVALSHAVETAAPLFEARQQEFSVSLPAGGTLCVDADKDRLAQAFGNLLANAAKYTESGGKIWLEARPEGGFAVVRVRDTGLGIAPEMLPHVFDLFTQADRTLDRAQGGLGIGLTLVRSLVEMHGGNVEARSAGLGQGSEFIVRLPILPEQAREPGPAA